MTDWPECTCLRVTNAVGEVVVDDRCGEHSRPETNVYRERAHLLALLAAVAMTDGQAEPMVHIGETDPETPGWQVITFELETGQASWHIAPEDLDLFRHVRATTVADRPWDRHSTEEKYERVQRLIGALLTTTTED